MQVRLSMIICTESQQLITVSLSIETIFDSVRYLLDKFAVQSLNKSNLRCKCVALSFKMLALAGVSVQTLLSPMQCVKNMITTSVCMTASFVVTLHPCESVALSPCLGMTPVTHWIHLPQHAYSPEAYPIPTWVLAWHR